MNKIVIITLSISLACLTLLTCITPGISRQTITIGVFGDLESSISQVVNSREFKSAFPGVRIRFEADDFGGHHDRIIRELDKNARLNDIELLEIGYLARFAREGGFTDMSKPPFNGFDHITGLAEYAVANATTRTGILLAFPIDIANALLYYRKSFFDEAELDINEICTWEDIIEAGKKLTKDFDGDGNIDRYAFPNANDFDMIPIHGGKGNWFDENNIPLQPADRFLKSLKVCKAVRDSGIDAGYPSWSGKWINSFKEGKVAMLFSGQWMYGHFKNWMCPDIKGDWRVAYPSGIEYASYGGTYIGIPETTPKEKKELCFNIIKYLCTDYEAQKLMFEITMAYPAYTPVHQDSIMSIPSDYLGGQKIFELCGKITAKIPPANVSINDALAVDIFNNAVKSVIKDNVLVEEAYETAKKYILEMMY